MQRGLVLALCAGVCVCGCTQAPMSMEDLQKPALPSELERLNCMVGTWSGKAEMVSPTAEEIAKATPEGEEPMPSTFDEGSTAEWILGGMFLKNEGWMTMGEGEKAHYVELITWDPRAKKYRGWSFSDWGEHGEGWMTMSEDGKHLTFASSGKDFKGRPSRGKGQASFVDGNTMDWTWCDMGPMGKMEFKGTSRRTP
jgi:hypothetical protein